MRRDLRSDFVLSKRLPVKLVSEERLTVRLCCFFFSLLRRLPIGLASERRIIVRLVLFLKRLMVGLFCQNNRACE